MKGSKLYQREDDGINIPGFHPSVEVQMLVLYLPADKLVEVLDYIDKNMPHCKDDNFEYL